MLGVKRWMPEWVYIRGVHKRRLAETSCIWSSRYPDAASALSLCLAHCTLHGRPRSPIDAAMKHVGPDRKAIAVAILITARWPVCRWEPSARVPSWQFMHETIHFPRLLSVAVHVQDFL